MKVFFLGLDGLTLDVIGPYIGAGLLPNFKKVIDGGSSGILRSTIPPLTGPGWISLATGKNPGKHGIYEFRRRKGYETSIVTKSTSPYAEPVWKIVSRNGRKSAVINVPFTYPPDEIDGIMVSGLMTPGVDKEFVFPQEVKGELFGLVPDYRIDIDEELYLYSKDRSELVKEVYKLTTDGRKVMDHFMESRQWSLFFMVFTCPDRLQHFLWEEVVSMEPECVKCFQLLDEILGDVLKKMDDDTVLFIGSDHGFMRASKGFYINNFFKHLGLLNVRGNLKIKNDLAGRNISTYSIRSIIKKAGLLNFKKYLPSAFLDYIRKYLPSHGIKEGDFDYNKTKVFSSFVFGIVTVNLKGREPGGIVDEEDYDEIREMVKRELLAVKDPETDKNIVKDVFKGSEIYSSEYIDDRPDLVVVMNEGYSIIESLGGGILGENKIGSRYRTGDHERDGLFAVYGRNIKNRKVDAEIYDLTPTMLYLMGLAIPEDVDGRVLTEIISDEFIGKNEIRMEKTGEGGHSEESVLSEEETKKMERQLKHLGYFG